MKQTFTCFLTFISFLLYAQEYPTVSYSNNYAEHAFYRLTDDATTNIDNNSWEIAFSTFGAGIFINETSVVFGAQNVLYLAPTNNFEDPINTDDLTERLLNDEKTWDYGAFNTPRDENDNDDFGWGIYDPATEVITGNRVFALRFKNGTYKKIQVLSLAQEVYTLKYADLDGSNEVNLTIDQVDFPDNYFAYLSLPTGQILENIPSDWDLLFTRYSSPVDDGAGGTFDIVTSGILSAPGVEVAEARGVNPETVDYTDYVDSLNAEIDVIGFDWKEFDNVNWNLATDLAYFVKIPTGQVWKLIFLTFGGSGTGDVLFEKTSIVANTADHSDMFEDFNIYPNPINENTTVVFSIKKVDQINLCLHNVFGQKVWSGKYDANAGLNAIKLPDFIIPSGTYFLSIYHQREVITQKVYR